MSCISFTSWLPINGFPVLLVKQQICSKEQTWKTIKKNSPNHYYWLSSHSEKVDLRTCCARLKLHDEHTQGLARTSCHWEDEAVSSDQPWRETAFRCFAPKHCRGSPIWSKAGESPTAQATSSECVILGHWPTSNTSNTLHRLAILTTPSSVISAQLKSLITRSDGHPFEMASKVRSSMADVLICKTVIVGQPSRNILGGKSVQESSNNVFKHLLFFRRISNLSPNLQQKRSERLNSWGQLRETASIVSLHSQASQLIVSSFSWGHLPAKPFFSESSKIAKDGQLVQITARLEDVKERQ